MTLYIGGFSRVVAFPTAPIATGRSDPYRKGLAPSQEPCLSTAHASFVLLGDHRLVATVAGVMRSIIANLAPASERRNHTTSPSAQAAPVSHSPRVHRIPIQRP